MAWLQKAEKGRAMINFKKAQKHGFSGYYLDMALAHLAKELDLPLK
jgi:hypothetical protein